MTFEEWYEENVKYMNTADFKAWMSEAWKDGSKAEREACAKVCEDIDTAAFGSDRPAPNDCAAAIRARGEK